MQFIWFILKNLPLIIQVIREVLALLNDSDKDVRSSGIKEGIIALRSQDPVTVKTYVKERRESRQKFV